MYILKALPFNIWIPETKDLEKLRSWLLESPLNSSQHQMAKAVLSKMNFDIKQVSQIFLVMFVCLLVCFMPRNINTRLPETE